MKRSMQVNIFLKQFKASNEEIIEILKEGNAEKIGQEKLKGLIRVLPEKDEVNVSPETVTGFL